MTFFQWMVTVVVGGAVWAVFGWVAYSCAQQPYKWSKKMSLLFALGGPITGIGATYDVWMHTSMMGSYTRDWGKNPDEYVVSWRELEGKAPLTRMDKAAESLVVGFSMGFQYYAGIRLWLGMQGHNVFDGTLSCVFVAIGIMLLSVGLFLLWYDILGMLIARFTGQDVLDQLVLTSDGVIDVFLLEAFALLFVALAGGIIYVVIWLLRAGLRGAPKLIFG